MRLPSIFGLLCVTLIARTEAQATNVWQELRAKREKLPGVHQEFDVSQTFKTAKGSQSSKRQIVIDMSQGQWRESAASGSGSHIRIFDGMEIIAMEDGGDEFVRTKRRPKDEFPAPSPYGSANLEWSKTTELQRMSCGIPGRDDQCVLLEVPLKPWVRNSNNSLTRMLQGSARVLLDLESGLILSLRQMESVDNARGGYQSEIVYSLKRMSYSATLDVKLFTLPSDQMREVKELSPWNATRIKKHLVGKPAPELAVSDIAGNPIALTAFKGKIVLLDFWTTWCPPCRADAPALDKLYKKYGEKDVVILGISVSEEHEIVAKFLKDHPHEFPIVLTTENEMPRPYQIGVFPTYIVIDRNGVLTSAVEGDRGFADLRDLLKKAHLEVE